MEKVEGYPAPSFRCPRCGGPVIRIHRRLIDRLVSLVRPSWRYLCQDRRCGWKGRGPQGY